MSDTTKILEKIKCSYNRVDDPEGKIVQYVGLYALKWGKEDKASVGFVELEEEELQALTQAIADRARVGELEEENLKQYNKIKWMKLETEELKKENEKLESAEIIGIVKKFHAEYERWKANHGGN